MSIVVLYQNSYINVLKSTLYISCHDNLNIVVVLSYVASYCYAFLTFCVRSACAFMRVCVHAYESGRNYIHAL